MARRAGHGGGTNIAAVTVTGSYTTQTIFTSQTPTTPNANDGTALTVGTRFISDVEGTITGVRAYRATTAPTMLIVLLYASDGTELARTTITNPGPGWNTGTFANPVTVTSGTTYMAAYFSNGPYVSASVLPIMNSHLATSGSRWLYGSSPTMPTNAPSDAVAYLVDPVFVYFDDRVPPSTPGSGPRGWQLTTANTGIAKWGLTSGDLPLYTGTGTPASGTTIYRKRVSTGLLLNAGNITVDQCLIQPTVGWGAAIIRTMDTDTFTITPSKVTIRDCEIDGSLLPDLDKAQTSGFHGIAEMTGCYIHDIASGVAVINSGKVGDTAATQLDCLIEGNYVRGLFGYGDPATTGNHCDGMTVREFINTNKADRQLTFRNNRSNCDAYTNATGAMFVQSSSGWINNVTIEGNLFEGGGWLLGLEGGHGFGYSNAQAINNRFATGLGAGADYVNDPPGWAVQSENYIYNAANSDGKGAPLILA